jgi:hypothetical protein
VANALDATHPNSRLMTWFRARTPPLVIPSNGLLRRMGLASEPWIVWGAIDTVPHPTPGFTPCLLQR